MFKIISTNSVIPRSLILTGIEVPVKRDYIGRGGFGGVFKGKLQGKIVALKVLHRTSDNVVKSSLPLFSATSLTLVLIGILSRSLDVGNAQAQVCTVILGNL